MKKAIQARFNSGVSVLLAMSIILQPAVSRAGPYPGNSEPIPFTIYKEADLDRHFAPSGQIGDVGDLSLSDNFPNSVSGGQHCIRIEYSGAASQGARWAGVYWQEPDFNFGELPGAGYNLRAAGKLTFWARGDKGGERISVKAGGIQGAYPDSFDLPLTEVQLTSKWCKYTVALNGLNLTYVIGGFYVGFAKDQNPEGATIYLDNIVYE